MKIIKEISKRFCETLRTNFLHSKISIKRKKSLKKILKKENKQI